MASFSVSSGQPTAPTRLDGRHGREGFLPGRYAVSGAFVIDADGNRSEQIDLVIHDAHRRGRPFGIRATAGSLDGLALCEPTAILVIVVLVGRISFARLV
jgi:hypothetical protein